MSSDDRTCAHRYERAADLLEPKYIEWQFPVGSHLSGRQRLDFDGDERPDDLSIDSEVQRDFAVDLLTKK